MYFEYTWIIAELKKQGWHLRFPQYYWEVLTAVKGSRKVVLHTGGEDNWSLVILGQLTSSEEEGLSNLVMLNSKVGPRQWDHLLAEDIRAMCECLSK